MSKMAVADIKEEITHTTVEQKNLSENVSFVNVYRNVVRKKGVPWFEKLDFQNGISKVRRIYDD